jgi:hypothetical protein
LPIDGVIENVLQGYFKCEYPECKNVAEYSYLIPRESLNTICRDNKLITVSTNIDGTLGKEFKLDYTEIDKAAKYKNFCLEHKKIFEQLDNHLILSQEDIFIQLFKSISHVIFEAEKTFAHIEKPYFKDKYNEPIMEIIKNETNGRINKWIQYKKI